MGLPKEARNSFTFLCELIRFTYDLVKYDGLDGWVITRDRMNTRAFPACQKFPICEEKTERNLVSSASN